MFLPEISNMVNVMWLQKLNGSHPFEINILTSVHPSNPPKYCYKFSLKARFNTLLKTVLIQISGRHQLKTQSFAG